MPSNWNELVRRLLRGRGARPARPAKFRVESLEDRAVPSVSPVSVSVVKLTDAAEGGAAGVFRFTRSDSTGGEYIGSIDVSYTVGGTAADGDDYTLSGVITLPSNGSHADLTVVPKADNVVEGDETVEVTVNPGADYTAAGDPATVTLSDDPPVVSVSTVSDAAEGGAAGVFRFARTGGDVSQPLTVVYTVGGTAAGDSRLPVLSGVATFAANASTADLAVSLTNDALPQLDGTLTVAIADDPTGYVIGADGAASLAVADDDTSITFTLDDGTDGALAFDIAWGEVDPALSSQSVAVSNFALLLDGITYTAANATFDTVPTAQFESGEFVGLAFALNTSGVPGSTYTAITMAGLTVAGLNGVTGLFSVTAGVVNPALVLDFSGYNTGDETRDMTVTWTAGGRTDSVTIQVLQGTSSGAVRDMVFSTLRANGLNVTLSGENRLVVEGPAGRPLGDLRLSIGTEPPTGFVGPTVAGRLPNQQGGPTFWLNGRQVK